MDSITVRDARRLFLDRQGLLRKDQFGRGFKATRRAARSIGWVQIDTISVVERAHHHVLRTRVPGYDPAHLHRLLHTEREVFEYWSHAAAYLPMDEYRFALPVMAGSAIKRRPDKKLASEILARIRNEGPLSARHFEAPPGHKSGGWWDWKPAKVCLEYLFLSGEIMVCHRNNFQKVYDLRERVLPDHVDTRCPDPHAWHEHLVMKMVDAKGVANDFDVGYQSTAVRQLTGNGVTREIKAATRRLLEQGRLVAVDVAGETHYSTPEILACLPLRTGKRQARFLSPFDNLVINRRRAQRLFDFDYQIECYVPAAKRVYGYFALPILHGEDLVGRLDARADRKTGTLHLNNLVIDDASRIDDELITHLTEATRQFALDNDCEAVMMHKVSDSRLKAVH